MTYHGVEICGLDRGNVARNGSFCASCGRTTATANCPHGRFDPFAKPSRNDRYLRILFSNGSRGSSVYRRLGMPAFSARSLALDGVSVGAGRQG